MVRMIDAICVETYRASIEPILPQGAALVAAGGYGKRELFPYSSVDILILLEGESPWVSLREPLAECIRMLWDAGLRVNHTVRTVSECLEFREQNVDLNINLLDLRFLAGDQTLYSRFENKWPGFLEKHGPKLSQHLVRHTKVRHSKYQNTVHHREPDTKDAPGGLRDWNLIGSLSRLGAESVHTTEELNRAVAFLSTVRCFLHYQFQSDRNLLDLEAEERIIVQPFSRNHATSEPSKATSDQVNANAQAATATSQVTATSHQENAASHPANAAPHQANATSQWMREYYRHAWVVFNEARRSLGSLEKPESSLAGNFRDWRTRLSNSEFTVARERVFLRSPAQLDADPAVMLRLLEFIARHGIAPAPDTERRLEAARSVFANYCAEPRPLWSTLESIFSLPHASVAIRALQRTGLLTALFPELDSIVDLTDPEPAHRHTVDEHALMAVERATELTSNTDPARQRFAQLLSEIENRAVLILTFLFHRAGAGSPGAAPVRLAMALARQAMERMRMAVVEQDQVSFLIEHQGDLAEVMTGRDVDDPATARQLAGSIGTIERLKLLTVLTYGNLAAVNSEAMTAWRLERMWRAYEVTRHELTRELETERIQDVPENVPARPAFLKGLPVRYLRVHSPREIEEHMRLYEESRPAGVAVQLDRIDGAYRLTVIARDMPALFASFAGAISSFGLDILKAEAFSNARGIILDTFVFSDPQRTLELNPPESERLLDLIRRVALGKTDGQRLLRNRAQADPKKRAAPPQVNFDSDACDTATLVEIVAEDRPGLLYNLATVFSSTACNIDVVLIDTKGHRAIDVFYVAHDGRKLSPELQATLKDKLLAVC